MITRRVFTYLPSHTRLFRYARVAILLGLLTLLAYVPALRTTFFSDDYVLLWQARAQSFNMSLFQVESHWFFYRPLGKLTWLIMYRLWGHFPVPYHILSLMLHWMNGLLIVALVRQLLPQRRSIALIAGMLFVVYPLQVEAVVWSACYYDLLATFFYLLTLLCLLRTWHQGTGWWYLLSLVTYQFSLWSKELAFTLPLMVVALGVVLVNRPSIRRIIIATLPYLLLLSLNLLQRYLTWGSIGGYPSVESNILPRIWDTFAMTFATMIAPLNRFLFSASFVQVWLLVMTIIILAGLMSGYNQRLVVVALVWIVIALLPVLTIVPIGTDLQNSRLLYLASIGFCLGLAALLDALVQRLGVVQRRGLVSGVIVLTTAYLITVQVQVQPWLVAGRETIHTVQELHRLMPYLGSGTKLQTIGLPDTYKGAFIYRLGLPEAYDLFYGGRFELEQAEHGRSPANESGDNLFQVRFGFDPATERWEIVQAKGRAAPPLKERIRSLPARTWDFTPCQGNGQWSIEQWGSPCQPGRGLQLAPAQEQRFIKSPSLDLADVGWMEVVVRLEGAANYGADSSIALEWTTQGNQSWKPERSLVLDAPQEKQSYDYHFFIPPDGSGTPLQRLRLRSLNTRSALAISAISVRPIP